MCVILLGALLALPSYPQCLTQGDSMSKRIKQRLVTLASVVAVCAFGVAAPAAEANLVANGDFETGAFAPEWTLSPGGPFDHVCKTGDPIGAAICIAHGGLYAMSFGLAGSQDTLSQN